MRAAADVLPGLYAGAMLMMGGLSLGLWQRQRDALYGCFGLAALCGSVRPLAAAFGMAPSSSGALAGAVMAMTYAAQLALMARFALLVTGGVPRWLDRVASAALWLAVLMAALSFAVGWRGLWTAALLLLLINGLACFWFVQREARQQRRAVVWAILIAGSLLLAAGVHDLGRVRTQLLGVSATPWAPHALIVLLLVLAGIVVERYSDSVRQLNALNADLQRRVAEREAQLREAFEALRVQREEQAALQERQRIMRDIHDGVGSQLVGLLGLVGLPQRDPKLLQQQVEAALDELRMAVDSMQPVHGDLATVLATLRYRLQPRLQASGLAIVWAVDALPPLDDLSPNAVLQVQRILLEAFTNVIRHARATTVTVSACYVNASDAPHLRIAVADDGIGMPADLAAAGQGLRNMHARAAAIGAQLSVQHMQSEPARGTCVLLEWPLTAPGLTPHRMNA